MHLAVIKHDILVIILKQSDQCFILSDEYIVHITYNGPRYHFIADCNILKCLKIL